SARAPRRNANVVSLSEVMVSAGSITNKKRMVASYGPPSGLATERYDSLLRTTTPVGPRSARSHWALPALISLGLGAGLLAVVPHVGAASSARSYAVASESP